MEHCKKQRRSSFEVSNSVGQCRLGNHDWRDEEETWEPNGEEGSSAYWELSFETKTVADSRVTKKVTFYPSPYWCHNK